MYVIEFRVYTTNIKSLNKLWKENYLIVTKIALHFSIENRKSSWIRFLGSFINCKVFSYWIELSIYLSFTVLSMYFKIKIMIQCSFDSNTIHKKFIQSSNIRVFKILYVFSKYNDAYHVLCTISLIYK